MYLYSSCICVHSYACTHTEGVQHKVERAHKIYKPTHSCTTTNATTYSSVLSWYIFKKKKIVCMHAHMHIIYDRSLLRVVLNLIWKMFYLSKHSKNKCKQTSNLCSLKSDWTLWHRLLLWQSCPSMAQCTRRTWIEGIWYYRKSDNEELQNLYILLKWPSQQVGHAARIRENEKYTHI